MSALHGGSTLDSKRKHPSGNGSETGSGNGAGNGSGSAFHVETDSGSGGADAAANENQEARNDVTANPSPESEMKTKVINGTLWYHCIPCNKPLNTMDQFLTHQKSPKHAKARMKRASGYGLSSSTDRTEWYQCRVCQKQVNSAEQLEMHMGSHANSGSLATDGGAAGCQGLGADRTIWHTCSVCNKRVNTEKQLQIHMRSHAGTSASGPGNLAPDSSASPANQMPVLNIVAHMERMQANIDDLKSSLLSIP